MRMGNPRNHPELSASQHAMASPNADKSGQGGGSDDGDE
jgi:hypothetical protein